MEFDNLSEKRLRKQCRKRLISLMKLIRSPNPTIQRGLDIIREMYERKKKWH